MTTIAFTGDIAFDEYFQGAYKREDLIDESISEFLHNSDHVVANIEGPITTFKTTRNAVLVHSQNPECLDFLKEKMNVDVVNLANNHMRDNGHVGIADSVEYARRANLIQIGAGDCLDDFTASCMLGDDVKVGIISMAQPWKYVMLKENRSGVLTWDKKTKIKREIQKLRDDGADYVLILAHGGVEFMHIPAPYIRNTYKKLLAMGVDGIVAHHPHVVENYEIIGGKPVFYSLGNCIFDTDYQRRQARTENGVILRICADEEGLTWDSIGIRIDRENQRIVEDEVPAIFTELTEKEWDEVWPLQAKISLDRDLVFKSEKIESLQGKSKAAVLRYTIKQAKKIPKTKDMVDGAKKSILQAWRFASRKDVLNYIQGK